MDKNRDIQSRSWYRLDNAALIYPAIESTFPSLVWRIAATLDREVEPLRLKQALKNVMPRFPYFATRLKRGFFWFYLEANDSDFIIYEDPKYPCIGIDYKKNRGYLFTLKRFGKRIALEAFHAFTDGGGGTIFLNNIVAEYLRLDGEDIPPAPDCNIFDLAEPAPLEEYEDCYHKYYSPEIKKLPILPAAYHFSGTLEREFDRLHNLTGHMSVSALSKVSKEFGATITEYMLAVYFSVIQDVQREEGKTGVIRIPVAANLRNIFECRTMRNFSYIVNVEIDTRLGVYDFEEILSAIRSQMKAGLTKKSVVKGFSANVNTEKNLFLRMTPLFLKVPVMTFVYSLSGDKQCTSAFSNLGKVKLPDSMKPHVLYYTCNTMPSSLSPVSLTSIGYGDEMCMSFTSRIKEREIERKFFTALVKAGIRVRIESND